jgi:hypothetical protein
VTIVFRTTKRRREASLLSAAVLACCELLAGCAAGSTKPPVSAIAPAVAIAFGDDSAPLGRYHSKRLAVSVPLPDKSAWRINDVSQPELVGTHAPTRSKVVVAVFHADELVGRVQCEALSRARKLVPAGDLRTLEDAVAITQETFDTRVWVAVEPGGGPRGSLVGHVMAFGGFLRKCFAFVFSTQVDSALDEPILSSRLAFARARVLGELQLDAFGAISHDSPVGPGIAPRR